mmetsp:Transcript_62220/g.157178  ORF Transcript_62220/g.157178 Transcript_62220/m.157178 type:complete len:259 (-) Transcript_62220:180-956(-)
MRMFARLALPHAAKCSFCVPHRPCEPLCKHCLPRPPCRHSNSPTHPHQERVDRTAFSTRPSHRRPSRARLFVMSPILPAGAPAGKARPRPPARPPPGRASKPADPAQRWRLPQPAAAAAALPPRSDSAGRRLCYCRWHMFPGPAPSSAAPPRPARRPAPSKPRPAAGTRPPPAARAPRRGGGPAGSRRARPPSRGQAVLFSMPAIGHAPRKSSLMFPHLPYPPRPIRRRSAGRPTLAQAFLPSRCSSWGWTSSWRATR